MNKCKVKKMLTNSRNTFKMGIIQNVRFSDYLKTEQYKYKVGMGEGFFKGFLGGREREKRRKKGRKYFCLKTGWKQHTFCNKKERVRKDRQGKTIGGPYNGCKTG